MNLCLGNDALSHTKLNLPAQLENWIKPVKQFSLVCPMKTVLQRQNGKQNKETLF